MFRKSVLGVGLFLGSLLSIPASALIYEYQYIGNELVTTDDYAGSSLPETYPGYNGIMKIDESLLVGGTLANASVSFYLLEDNYGSGTISTPFGTLSSDSRVDGLLDYTVATSLLDFPAVAGTRISFRTNSSRRIISWNIAMLDGPPDGGITSFRGDDYVVSEEDYVRYLAAPGTWTSPKVVPLPPSLILSFSGMVFMYGLMRVGRRKRHLQSEQFAARAA